MNIDITPGIAVYGLASTIVNEAPNDWEFARRMALPYLNWYDSEDGVAHATKIAEIVGDEKLAHVLRNGDNSPSWMVEFSTDAHFDDGEEMWTDEVWVAVSADLEEVARRLLAHEMELWAADGKVYEDQIG